MISKIQRFKLYLNAILNGGSHSVGAKIFRPFITFLVLLNVVVVTIYSLNAHQGLYSFLQVVSYFSGAVFTFEYLLRVWIAPIHNRDHKRLVARIKYLFSFYGLIDFISILPFAIPLFFEEGDKVSEFMNFVRLFLIFKVARYSRSFALLRDVLHSARQELLLAISFSLVIVSFSALAMYYIEKGAQPEVFSNIGEGFWWAVITFTTVGYGDIAPITPMGKFLAASIAFVGIGMIAMPTAIISSALMNRMAIKRAKDEERRQQEEHKKSPKVGYCPHCGMKLPREAVEHDEKDDL